VKNASPEAM